MSSHVTSAFREHPLVCSAIAAALLIGAAFATSKDKQAAAQPAALSAPKATPAGQ